MPDSGVGACDVVGPGGDRQRHDCEVCYRAVFRAVPEPVLVADGTGLIVDANPAAHGLYGFDAQGLRGASLAELFAWTPLTFDGRPARLAAVPHRARDGRCFLGEAVLSYIPRPDGMLVILVIRNVTETLEAQSRLEEAEERWRFALDGAGDGVWDWSLESGEIEVSSSFRALIGWPDAVRLRRGDIWPGRLHPDDVRGAMAAFAAHLTGARPIAEAEFRLRLEDGSYRWVALRGRVMERDPEGLPRRMIGTVRDVHERYLGVEREKRQQQELERAARLIHVGEMASSLAHELNQPLTALRNFSAVALRRLEEPGAADERLRAPLTMIAEQALRAGAIVNQVRSFARKGGGKAAAVALNEVVHSVLRFMEFEIRAHAVQCILELDEALPAVQADQVQMEQVLSNLIKNGIDAMDAVPSERILRIRSRRLPDAAVELAVSDSGEGLADAVRADPFAPFATTKADGVGLGLAICRSIVENHGGRLWVDSSSAAGTRFCFSLPVACA